MSALRNLFAFCKRNKVAAFGTFLIAATVGSAFLDAQDNGDLLVAFLAVVALIILWLGSLQSVAQEETDQRFEDHEARFVTKHQLDVAVANAVANAERRIVEKLRRS